jgi:hypothetical protein
MIGAEVGRFYSDVFDKRWVNFQPTLTTPDSASFTNATICVSVSRCLLILKTPYSFKYRIFYDLVARI